MNFQNSASNFEWIDKWMEEWTDRQTSPKQYAPSTFPKLGAYLNGKAEQTMKMRTRCSWLSITELVSLLCSKRIAWQQLIIFMSFMMV